MLISSSVKAVSHVICAWNSQERRDWRLDILEQNGFLGGFFHRNTWHSHFIMYSARKSLFEKIQKGVLENF